MRKAQPRRGRRKSGKIVAALITGLSIYIGSPVFNVMAAEQPLVNAQVQVGEKNVANKVIHTVIIQGNTISKEKQIRAALPALREGQVLNVKTLSDEIMLANENGFRQLTVDLRPAADNMLDAYVTVRETDAVKFVLATDNTGNDYTGDWRTRLTYVNGNVNGSGQTGIISYTTSPGHLRDVKQFGLYYNFPLPKAKDNLYLTASYSDANSGTIISDSAFSIDASGKGNSVGLHYVHNLLRTPTAKQGFDFGLDFRQYKNDTTLTVGATPIEIGVDVDSMPLSVTYQGSQRYGSSFTAYSLGYVRNLPGGGKNSTAQYEKYRSNTDANYQLWRGSYNYQHMFSSKWLVNVVLTGQYTNERLIYPEQLGLGGARSVRGLDERDVSGDRGLQASLELYTPEIAKGQRLLAFIDAGHFSNVKPVSGDLDSDSAAACGIGWRASFGGGYSVSADFGYVLNGTVNTDAHSKKLHFSASKVF